MTTTATKKKPQISVVKHELDRMSREGEGALSKSGLPIYQRFGELVRVRRGERLTVEPKPTSELLRHLSMAADWFCWIPGKRQDEPAKEPVKPPTDVVQILNDQGEWDGVPELLHVYDAPTLRPDGTVLQDPGYDAATKSIYAPRVKFPRVADKPTDQDVQTALDKLHWPVHEFPWKHATDFSTFLSLLFTVVGRPSIDGPTPLFVVRATDRAIGKSKLVQVVNLIATGAPAPVMTYHDDPEEENKSMLALGRSSTQLALIDNVDVPLGGAVLAACLTSRTYHGRELGYSRMLEVPVPVLVATGVNVMAKDDIGRRVLPIDLDPPAPDWKKRTFKIRDLDRWTLDHRAELAHAALTILRAFHVAGCPQSAGLSPYASYESWTERVRAVCTWLGLEDPVLGNERFTMSADMDRDSVLAFLETWHERFGTLGSTISEALQIGRQRDTELLEAMLLLDPKCNPERFDSRRASVHFQRVQGRFVGGYRLEAGQKTKHGAVWRVVTTSHLASPNVTPSRHLANPFNGTHLQLPGDAVTRLSTSMVADVQAPQNPRSVGGGRVTESPPKLNDEGNEGSGVTRPPIRVTFGESPASPFDAGHEGRNGSGVTRGAAASGPAASDWDDDPSWILSPDEFENE